MIRAAASLALIALTVGSASAAGAQHRSRPAGAVSVQAHEYRLTLSRTSVSAGTVVFEFDNHGQDPHNLVLARLGANGDPIRFGTLRAGARSTSTLRLGAGRWRLWCSLPGHDQLGMHAVLTVKRQR